jgi:hypothetical protein
MTGGGIYKPCVTLEGASAPLASPNRVQPPLEPPSQRSLPSSQPACPPSSSPSPASLFAPFMSRPPISLPYFNSSMLMLLHPTMTHTEPGRHPRSSLAAGWPSANTPCSRHCTRGIACGWSAPRFRVGSVSGRNRFQSIPSMLLLIVLGSERLKTPHTAGGDAAKIAELCGGAVENRKTQLKSL